jgi:hypothetical protein
MLYLHAFTYVSVRSKCDESLQEPRANIQAVFCGFKGCLEADMASFQMKHNIVAFASWSTIKMTPFNTHQVNNKHSEYYY